MNKIQSSWELVKASFRVIKADKELMIFPIISSISLVFVTITFFIPSLFAGIFEESGLGVISYVVLFLYYLAQYTVIFFFNTALVGAAMIRLQGGDPTLKDGFRIALSRFGAILGYAAIAATVGLILRALSRKGNLGRIVSSIFGLAWNIATFLVVPVLAMEGVGPIEAIKRSVSHLRKSWGEQIIGNLGIGAVFGLVFFLMILLFIPIVWLVVVYIQSTWAIIVMAALMVFALVILSLIQSTLNGIYTAAVYQYATTGKSSGFFDENLVQQAFRQE